MYRANNTYILVKSAHIKTDKIKPVKIINPPIVGVPIFFIIWSEGPSSLIGSVYLLVEKNLIKGFPINKTITNDVNTDNPVRNVKYLNTFKKEKVSTKFKIKL